MNRKERIRIHCSLLPLFVACFAPVPPATAKAPPSAGIEIDASQVTGHVSPFLFGHFIEHEHNIIQGGLWAELLRDRKFEQGDADRDGVSDGWVPEERVQNRYWKLIHGRGPHVRYFIDHQVYYGGGAAQAIRLEGPHGGQAGIYQIGLRLVKGRRYSFYAYLKQQGSGRVQVDLGKLGGSLYASAGLAGVTGAWKKFSADFSVPEDTDTGRLRIAFEGAGTLWIDSVSLMPADNLQGMRRDVIDALKPLKVPIMRYPGGCFADEYHWRNGVGPRDQRPETWTRIWNNWDPNDFGTDEFMVLARELGFAPHITLNYASGTVEEAAAWVEYANGATSTPMGSRRAQNGHAQPYGIRFWAAGNEAAQLCSGQYIGSNRTTGYALRFRQFLAAMRKVDPSIRLIAGGTPPGPESWNRELMELLPADLLAISIYTGEPRDRLLGNRIFDQENAYRRIVAEPSEFERELDRVLRDTANPPAGAPPQIAISEFNSWWISEKVDPDYRLGNALYFAGVFNSLLRRAPRIFTAEVATTINVQGLIAVDPAGVKLTPPYFTFALYANHTGDRVLSTSARSPMAGFDANLAALDVVATLSADGASLYVAAVNRSEAEDIPAAIAIRHWVPEAGTAGQVFELNGKDRFAANPYNSAGNVNIRTKSIGVGTMPWTYTFPAHSVTVLEIRGKVY